MNYTTILYSRPVDIVGPDGLIYTFYMARNVVVNKPVTFKESTPSLFQTSYFVYSCHELDASLPSSFINSRYAVPLVQDYDFDQSEKSYKLMYEVINPSSVVLEGTNSAGIVFFTNTDSQFVYINGKYTYDSSKVAVYDPLTDNFYNQETKLLSSSVYTYLCSVIIQWRYVKSGSSAIKYIPVIESVNVNYRIEGPVLDVGKMGNSYDGFFKLFFQNTEVSDSSSQGHSSVNGVWCSGGTFCVEGQVMTLPKQLVTTNTRPGNVILHYHINIDGSGEYVEYLTGRSLPSSTATDAYCLIGSVTSSGIVQQSYGVPQLFLVGTCEDQSSEDVQFPPETDESSSGGNA